MGVLIKVIIFTVGGVMLSYWLRNLFRAARSHSADAEAENAFSGKKVLPKKQTITCCNHCGIFVPESVIVHGRLGDYCSKEHKDLCEKGSR